MKTTITHLPENKQEELQLVANIICDGCSDVEKVVLFGSYARGSFKEASDLAPDRRSGHLSDYDILVITQDKATATDTELWHKITKICNAKNVSAHVRIITHDIQEINIKLAEGQYFYSDVKKEGCLLYDAKTSSFAEKRELTPAEDQRIAQDYFDHWFNGAQSYYRIYKLSIDINEHKVAVYNLHQTAESCYKTILLVFTAYNPHEHLLDYLLHMAVKYEPSLGHIFPTETREQKERLELLDYAYIGSRYDPSFRVTEDDLMHLSKCVKTLLEATEQLCRKKISQFL